jgi:predicted RNA-binding Zn-ribbon protein involved in translation (DUF1610 family)
VANHTLSIRFELTCQTCGAERELEENMCDRTVMRAVDSKARITIYRAAEGHECPECGGRLVRLRTG